MQETTSKPDITAHIWFPAGRLFNAIISADSDQLIKFIFPSERLPAHTQVGSYVVQHIHS
jgi:hypothetical protein